MTAYDVFNGDADGLCALQQLRLARPVESRLVTGVKRDIQLLGRVFPEPGDEVTVLDISLDSNRTDLVRILEAGAEVSYFDHHFSGEVPSHGRLRAHLNGRPDVCTSLLVDQFLDGRHRRWAIVGAFGDNLDAVASELAARTLGETEIDRLKELGRLLNYNGYGSSLDDLHFPPDRLFGLLHPYADPLDVFAEGSVLGPLRDGYASDMSKAADLEPSAAGARFRVYVLPDAAWSRRVSGVMANEVIRRHPDQSHAVLVPNTTSGYVVSVRIRADSPRRADEFCRQFPTGGGRAAAAGINHLPHGELEDFIRKFHESFA